jgi:hypothetical protein
MAACYSRKASGRSLLRRKESFTASCWQLRGRAKQQKGSNQTNLGCLLFTGKILRVQDFLGKICQKSSKLH